MPVLDLQRRLRELGRIRMGAKTSKGAPTKLKTFRLTSPSSDLLERAAAIYGGTVDQWHGAPGEGVQFELLTESDVLEAIVPPGSYLSQFYEMWSGGGCQRRCDGETEMLSDRACLCPQSHEERSALAAKGKACKITTRLSLILPNLPDIGVWRLESHGYYAAVELSGAQQVCAVATQRGQMVPVRLRLDQRSVRRPGQPVNHFAVPVLEVGATLGEIMGSLDGATLAAPTEPEARMLAPADAETNVRVLREGVRLADGVARVEAPQTLEGPKRSSRQRASAPMPGSPPRSLGDAAFSNDDAAPDLGPAVAPPAPPADDVEPEPDDDAAVPKAEPPVAEPVATTGEAQAAASSPPALTDEEVEALEDDPLSAAEATAEGHEGEPAATVDRDVDGSDDQPAVVHSHDAGAGQVAASAAFVRATREQVVKLIVLAEKLKWDRNTRLHHAGDVNSLNDLSIADASRLIEEWSVLVGDEPPVDVDEPLDDPVLSGGRFPGKTLSWLAQHEPEYLRQAVDARQLTPAGLAAAREWLKRREGES